MREIENIAAALFDKIRTRFENVSIGDEASKATTDPEKARFINFDYEIDGKKVGNITISLIDENSLKVYFNKDIVDRIQALDLETEESGDEPAETQWYAFLRSLREFAKRNLLSFDTRDITKSNLQLRDIKQQAKADATFDKDEVALGESRMYGTTRSSYEEHGPTKIIVRHSKNVDETKRGARGRNIDAVFVETHLGERFLLPFKNLHGARAMAQHMSQGGRMDDELGEGICGMVGEMNSMAHFVREAKRRQFEDSETDAMAKSAVRRYEELKKHLHHIGGRRGYDHYKETYMPEGDIEETIDVNSLRERFVKKIYNDKFDEALPYVYRAYLKQKNKQETPMAEEFASWAEEVTEGSWALPDSDIEIEELDKIMSKPNLRLGNGAEDAIGQLYNVIGDDELYDRLDYEAEQMGPDADGKPIVIQWLFDNGYAELAERYQTQYTQDMTPVNQQSATLQQQTDVATSQAVGAPGTDPSVVKPVGEGSDPLEFLKSLAGLRK